MAVWLMRVPWRALFARVGGLAVWRLVKPLQTAIYCNLCPCRCESLHGCKYIFLLTLKN